MKEETKKLFYIGKQFVSNSLIQVIDGIESSRLFFLSVDAVDCLNTLFISILDLYTNTKITYIRFLVTQLLCDFHYLIPKLPSRPEISAKLIQSIKSPDIIMRLSSLRIIRSCAKIFEKDSSLYHYLLLRMSKILRQVCLPKKGYLIEGDPRISDISRIQQEQQNKTSIKKQAFLTLSCLSTIIQKSQYLTSIFSNNIKELAKLGKLPTHIIAYLCSQMNFQSSTYYDVLMELWSLVEKSIGHKNRKIRYYFSIFLIRSCRNNYRCVELYEKYFQSHFPKLQKLVRKIKLSTYSFMVESFSNSQFQILSDPQLLDLCYNYYSFCLQLPFQLERIVVSRIKGFLNFRRQDLLFSYYLSSSSYFLQQIDSLILRKFELSEVITNSLAQERKLFKISLVVGEFSVAFKLLQRLLNKETMVSSRNMSVFMLLGSYIQLQLTQSRDALQAFLSCGKSLAQVGGHERLLKLLELWQKKYEGQNQEKEEQWRLREERKKGQRKSEIEITCEEQLRHLESLSACIRPAHYRFYRQKILSSENQDKVVQIQTIKVMEKKYGEIYFCKPTILQICKYL